MIQYLKHSHIDKQKWDTTIRNSSHPLIYALSWYLDIVSPDWEALVEGDYETIMSLTKGPRYGIRYLRQPYFCQQLGVFSIHTLTKGKTTSFLLHTPARYKLIDIQLNSSNSTSHKKFIITKRKNYLLPVSDAYDNIQAKYSTNTKRNIKKAIANDLVFDTSITCSEVVQFTKTNANYEFSGIDFTMLERLLTTAQAFDMGFPVGIKHNNEFVAVVFFMKFNNRFTYLVATSNSRGHELNAMFFLIDTIIKKYAETETLLDFEGSMLEGVARFYKGFGAHKEEYLHVKQNKLPMAVKWVVKK